MKNKKILIIIIIMNLVLAVAGTVLGYLFVATDTFKSDKELFAKYMTQNKEALQKISNLKINEVYESLKNENKYESNTQINVSHSEGGEISNPINELEAKIDIQKDNEDEYFYADGQILFAGDKYLEAEIIKEKELYGIRFSDVVKQFMTVKEDERLETVADNIGIDIIKLNEIIETIDGTKDLKDIVISKDVINTLKERYLSIIKETLLNGAYGRQKNVMITYNNVTTKANAYTVIVKSEQIEEMLVKLLNNLKTEEIILNSKKNEEYGEKINEIIKNITEEVEVPTVKITLFEQKQKTLRTVIEIGSCRITIENMEENGAVKSQIQLMIPNDDKFDEYDIAINKLNSEQQGKFEIELNCGEGEEKYTINFLNEVQLLNSEIELDTSISYKKGIKLASIKLKNNINMDIDFEKKQKLEDNNNLVLNNVEETRRLEIIKILKEKVPEKVKIRLDLLAKAIGLKEDETDDSVENAEMTQIEINKFNAKFEFYTGESVSAENVTTLLNVVKDNIGTFEINTIENHEEETTTGSTTNEKEKYNFKLIIEKDKIDENAIKQIVEKIDDQKKYKVLISYKEQNGLIDYITIDEVEE